MSTDAMPLDEWADRMLGTRIPSEIDTEPKVEIDNRKRWRSFKVPTADILGYGSGIGALDHRAERALLSGRMSEHIAWVRGRIARAESDGDALRVRRLREHLVRIGR